MIWTFNSLLVPEKRSDKDRTAKHKSVGTGWQVWRLARELAAGLVLHGVAAGLELEKSNRGKTGPRHRAGPRRMHNAVRPHMFAN